MTKRFTLAALLLVLLFTFVRAQTPPTYTSADIYLLMKKLKVLGTVLYIGAHPDDENTRLLAFLSKDKLYRTGYLSLTRGDGGQNLIGDEQGVELGLIRTQELLSARRIDGAEQFFSRAFDFGYTKTTDEAFKTWGKEKILSDVVWVIRKFQPDVIITRFPEDARAGHGHHSGSAVLAHEAFTAAADPKRFPEQLANGVKPWQAKRIFWNTFVFGNVNTTSDDQLKIEVGGYNPVLGKSYGEIAALSRSQHKSQGFGSGGGRGSQLEYFNFVQGEPAKTELMDDVNVSWSKLKGGAAIDAAIEEMIKNYSLSNPELSVPALVKIYKAISQIEDGNWREQKMKEVQNLIEICSGLWLEATTNTEFAVQGDHVRVNISLNNRLGAAMKLVKLSLDGTDTSLNKTLEKNINLNFPEDLYISPSKGISQPYWLQEPMSEGSFTVKDQKLIGKPENAPTYQAFFQVEVDGQAFDFVKPIQYKYTDPVKGELYQPLVVEPSTLVTTEPSMVIFKNTQQQTADVTVNVTANKNFSNYTATISRKLASDSVSKVDKEFSLSKGFNRNYSFSISNTMLNKAEQGKVSAMAQLKDGTEQQPAYLNITGITYDHIPHIHYFHQDLVKVLNIDIQTVGKRIGYIEGAGDKVPIALEQMGYSVTILKERDITPSNLKQFDAVMTGVRAYNVHDFLAAKYDILMGYVNDGGNFIVQYNTVPVRNKIGPYPFTVSRSRITDENATVNFEQPDNPVLNYPNKITSKDFENWIQERDIYSAEQVDPHYETPLSMADPNEQPQKGSLIIAPYGKGFFVYTGLVFFRELPAGVPGAFRLMANIIALSKKKGF